MIQRNLGMRKLFHSFVLLSLLITLFLGTGCASSKPEDNRPLPTNPAVLTGKLDNGIKYFIQKNNEPANRIMLRLVIQAGSNMEEED